MSSGCSPASVSVWLAAAQPSSRQQQQQEKHLQRPSQHSLLVHVMTMLHYAGSDRCCDDDQKCVAVGLADAQLSWLH